MVFRSLVRGSFRASPSKAEKGKKKSARILANILRPAKKANGVDYRKTWGKQGITTTPKWAIRPTAGKGSSRKIHRNTGKAKDTWIRNSIPKKDFIAVRIH